VNKTKYVISDIAAGVRAPALMLLAAVIGGCGGGGSGSRNPPAPQNAPPSLSAIPAQTIDQDTSTSALPFTVSDDGGVNGVTLVVSTNDATIVPVSGIALGGSGANRTITITPLEDATGQVNVGITATDGQGLPSALTVAVNVRAVQRSFSSFATTTFSQMENDTAGQVSGITFVQDAGETTFDPLLQ
jgi:hypothetical protein